MNKSISIRWLPQKKSSKFPYGVVWIVDLPEDVRDSVIELYKRYVRRRGVAKNKEIWVRSLGDLMELIHLTTLASIR